MKKLTQISAICALICSFAVSSFAITWFPKEFTCPIDNQKNTFMVVGSYGSYIYFYPSKYQWIFFPHTDSPTFYMCKKCHLATYMWDFDKIPEDKISKLRKILADVKVSKSFKDYQEISVSERLEVMEKVYSSLDMDEAWWEKFYRVKGYHYGKEGKPEKAAEARRKSLEIIQKQLKEEKTETPKKLLFYISASLKHFLSDDKGALEDLETALKTKYQEKGADEKSSNDAETGLNERINDYIKQIKSDKSPRMSDNSNDDDH